MATIKDVAKASGVCQATVSQVLNNGRRPVHPKTRERVIQVARSLDYRPNAVARGLVQKRMNTIGLAVLYGESPDQTNPFLLTLLDGVLSVSTRHRQNTMLCTLRNWEMTEGAQELSDGRCDGVLLLVPPADGRLTEMLLRRRVPFVLVNRQDPTGRMTCVDVDNVRGAFEMTRYLLGLGHRRITFVSMPWDHGFRFLEERQAGYRQAMTEAGLTVRDEMLLTQKDVLALDWAAPDAPTALFCAYDIEALDMMKALQARGMRVPDDISIVGFDDIGSAAGSRPALTTMRQPIARLGERAAEMLLTLIDGAAPGRAELFATELIVRQSAGPPRPGGLC